MSFASARLRSLAAATLAVLLAGALLAGFNDARAAAAKPAAPTALTFTSNSASVLGWQDNASDEDRFIIERCSGVGCTDFGVIGSTSAGATVYTDAVFPETLNRYRVRAWNDRGYSAYSNIVERSYFYAQVLRPTAQFIATPSSGDVPLIVTFDASSSIPLADRPLSSFEWWFGDGTSANGQVVTHTFASPATFAATLRVGDGSWSDNTAGNVSILAGPLQAPASLSATAPAKGVIVLSWTNRAYDATAILVQRCDGWSCTSFTTIADLGSSVTTYTDTTVGKGKRYSYRLLVMNDTGASAVSPTALVRSR